MTFDLTSLDFENIRKALKHFAATIYGEEMIAALEPAPNMQVAQVMQNSVSAARQCVDGRVQLELGEVPNIRVALRQASVSGSAVNTNAMFHILQVLRASELLACLIQKYPSLYPETMPPIIVPQTLIEEIANTVTDAGRLREDASPELQKLNDEMNDLRRNAEQTLKTFCQDKKNKPFIAGTGKHIWQGERIVVAVKSENLSKIKGVIKGSQAGGLEQLVEPLIALSINNAIERLSQKIMAEQQRILRLVTEKVREKVSDIQNLIDAIAWVDIAFAAGQLSAQMNAHAPTLVNKPYVELNQAYHPTLLIQFLQGKLDAPVPLSITIEENKPFILITGPNTGGKTVVLKTVGLLQIMAQCGLHIPAEADCTLGWFNVIMVDMGDKQSMYHQLSTFAGHIEVMKNILTHADQNALFLLDELGTGTDPEEGAALAMGMIDELIRKQSMGIVNTHLAPLKPYAKNHENIANAAMEFDSNNLSPTYRLKMGENGESFGLVIAERSGLSSNVTSAASEYLKAIKKQ